MIWFEQDHLPEGPWPFLNVVRVGLSHLEEQLQDSFDLREGGEHMLLTGCLGAYWTAACRRILDLAQSIPVLWNADLHMGAVASSRALLETLATVHSLLTRAQDAAAEKDWEHVGRLADAYAFSASSGPTKRQRSDDHPPRIGDMVTSFIKYTEPGKQEFWDQICDVAHPNGMRMMNYAGTLKDGCYTRCSIEQNRAALFPAIYNCLHSCCWLLGSGNTEFEILLEQIRQGDKLAPDHPLIVQRTRTDEVVKTVSKQIGKLQFGPRKASKKKQQK